MSKRAIILAGGKGTRLHPYTVVLPKPLMPIGEFPILEVIIRQLVQHGFEHITLAVNHQAEIIRAFFQDGTKWCVKIDYSMEDKPLSTIAPLRLINDLPENFLVMNGDILTNLSYSDIFEEHVSKKNIFTISSHVREQEIDYGVLETDVSGHLSGFTEKPKTKYMVSMGVYVVSRRIIDFIPEGQSYGFDNLMLDLIAAKQPAVIREFDGFWLDIGRPDDYIQAIEKFDNMQSMFLDG
jgi:NDP-sugar pyrophosphorylase family protein